jgi:hypothetical protein
MINFQTIVKEEGAGFRVQGTRFRGKQQTINFSRFSSLLSPSTFHPFIISPLTVNFVLYMHCI